MKRTTIFLLLAMFVVGGCGGSTPKIETPTSNRPDWIDLANSALAFKSAAVRLDESVGCVFASANPTP